MKKKKLMSAREYYYSVIAPEEKGKSYQLFHHGDEFWRNLVPEDHHSRSRLLNHQPKLSNDFTLEQQIEAIASRAPLKLKRRLRKVFVGKRRGYLPNALLDPRPDSYTGDLVFFNVGLSDACFQYSIVLAEFMVLKQMRSQMEDDNPQLARQLDRITMQLAKLEEAQAQWILDGDYVYIQASLSALDPPLDNAATKIAVQLSTFTDQFILAHEIAHGILGHTGREDIGTKYIQLLPYRCRKWDFTDFSHSREFQADAMALILVSGVYKPNKQSMSNPFPLKAAYGSLITLTVLGQFTEDVTEATDSHPAILDRFEQCRCILNIITPDTDLFYTEQDIKDFQRFLFISQKHGLGEFAV